MPGWKINLMKSESTEKETPSKLGLQTLSESFGHVASQTCAKHPRLDFSSDFFARHALSPFWDSTSYPGDSRQMPKCKISNFLH